MASLSDILKFAGPVFDLIQGERVVDVAAETIVKVAQEKINANPDIPYQLRVDGDLGPKTGEALNYMRAKMPPAIYQQVGGNAAILRELASIEASAKAIRRMIKDSSL